MASGQQLIRNMQPLFEGAILEPCLLHGDLWSGNISSDKNGDPVLLDPACYCKFHMGIMKLNLECHGVQDSWDPSIVPILR